jgi:hypothetical protein
MLYSLKGNISGIFHCNEYKAYHEKIDRIIRKKKIVLDIEFGGLGDWLVFTSLPRLLKEKYDIDFYLSEKSIAKVRNNIIFKMCFEMNPFYKGTDRNDDIFAYRPFTQEKNFLNFLFDIRGISVTENIEKQFGLEDCAKGMPEIYYKPKKMSAYENTILIDRHYISGKKLGWLYHDSSFEREAMKQMGLSHGLRIEYSDPLKQDLFTYADMVYSCRHFITPLSGGAALAACFDKPFTVILPYNVYGQSVNQFVFKRSRAQYIIKDLYNLKK